MSHYISLLQRKCTRIFYKQRPIKHERFLHFFFIVEMEKRTEFRVKSQWDVFELKRLEYSHIIANLFPSS